MSLRLHAIARKALPQVRVVEGQRSRRGGAVPVAVGDEGALMGAAGPVVVRVQVLDELGAGGARRAGPGGGVAVGVPESSRMSPRRMSAAGMRVRLFGSDTYWRGRKRTCPAWIWPGWSRRVDKALVIAAV